MIQFIKLQKEHLEMVMQWRIQPEVSQHMLTDISSDFDKQLQWFQKESCDETYRYWIIVNQDIPIGVFNLAAIDPENRCCSAGYYIGELQYRSLGAMLPPYFYNYIFNEMRFHKIYGEVVSGNENVLKMHQIHGYREVGNYRDHLYKNGQYYDVILIELLAEDWGKLKKYQRCVAEFA